MGITPHRTHERTIPARKRSRNVDRTRSADQIASATADTPHPTRTPAGMSVAGAPGHDGGAVRTIMVRTAPHAPFGAGLRYPRPAADRCPAGSGQPAPGTR